MLTFAEKPIAAERTTPDRPAAAGRARLARSPETRWSFHVRGATGSEGVRRPADAAAGHAGGGSPGLEPGHSVSRIPVREAIPRGIQPKPAVDTPGNVHEQEADRAAEQVVREPGPRPPSPAHHPHGRPRTERVQAGDTARVAAPPVVHEAVRSPGPPLDPATRAFMEQRFGHDFSGVRVHTGAVAEQSAREVDAHAYTVGSDIVFGAGRYAPESREGLRLLAHELTHVVQQGGGAAAVQRQPRAPGPGPGRAAAVAEAEAVAGVTREQLEAQSNAEDALKLDARKHGDKRYAWSLGRRDRARLQESRELSPRFRQEIAVKIRFFSGEARAAYIQTISPALADFPSGQVVDILAGPAAGSAAGGQKTQGPACDAGRKQFPLEYEGEPARTRCMDVAADPEFRSGYFDANIASAAGYSVGGTTWENVEYARFNVMLVKYRNGSSEYVVLNEVGDFHHGGNTRVALDHRYLKRKNGLIYPVHGDRMYFNATLAPNLVAYKNGLKYQARGLQELYALLQVAGAHALNLGAYGAGVGSFKASIGAFRRSAPAKLPGRPLPGTIARPAPRKDGVPEPMSDEADTQRIRAGDPVGEIVGDFRIAGEKTFDGRTVHRSIYGLNNTKGRTTNIGPIMQLCRDLIQEARAAGAAELKVTGHVIRNPNIFRIERIVERFGGTFRRTGPESIEIVIPLK